MTSFPRILFAVLVCLSVEGAVLRTTPEQRVRIPERIPSPYNQLSVSLASRGVDAFAVWSDDRTTRGRSLFGARLAADGTVLDPLGIVIDTETYARPDVAWNGTDYIAIASRTRPENPYVASEVFAWRITPEGKTVGSKVNLGSPSWPRLAGNGREVTLGSRDAMNFLDPSGRIERAIFLPGGYVVPAADGLDWFAFAQKSICDPKTKLCEVVLHQYALSASRAIASETPLFAIDRDRHTLAVASNDAGHFLLAWSELEFIAKDQFRRRVYYAVTERTGKILVRPTRLERTDVDIVKRVSDGVAPTTEPPSVVWDGRQFVVSWHWFDGNGTFAVHAMRVDGNGTQLDFDFSPIRFGATARHRILPGTRPAAVMTDTHLIVAWSPVRAPEFEARLTTVVHRAVASAEDLRLDAPPTLTSLSVVRQAGPLVAVNDEGAAFVLWSEGPLRAGLFPKIGPASESTVVSAPGERPYLYSVTWGGGVFLVVWRESDPDLNGPYRIRICARRFDRAGRPLDPAPVLLGEDWNRVIVPMHGVGIAFDGTQFLVTWASTTDGAIHARRIRVEGTISQPFAVSPVDSVRRGAPKPVWTGTEFAVVWYEDPTPTNLGGAPLPVLARSGHMTRVDAAGTVLDTKYPEIVSHQAGNQFYQTPFKVVTNGSELLVTWSVVQSYYEPYESCGFAQRFTTAGVPIDKQPVKLLCQPRNTTLAEQAYWNGEQWWLQYRAFAPDEALFLGPLDRVSLRLGTSTRLPDLRSGIGGGNAAWRPDELVLAYSRPDEQNANVEAVFLRRIVTARTRTVRH